MILAKPDNLWCIITNIYNMPTCIAIMRNRGSLEVTNLHINISKILQIHFDITNIPTNIVEHNLFYKNNQ